MWKWLAAAMVGVIPASAQTTPLPAAPPAFPKWSLQYFHDEDRTELRITGFAFPSTERGVAVGVIYDRAGRSRPQPTALVTSNGGVKWTPVALKEYPRSIFFLNESQGWLVTPNAIWATEESGRSWTRIADQIKPNGKLEGFVKGGLILRVWFLDAMHGFAVGLQKSVFETTDGGRTWVPVPEAAKPQANPGLSVYSQIAFTGGRLGIVTGGYIPRRPGDELPDWMMTEELQNRRQVPGLTLQLATSNGGGSWTSSTAPLMGSVAALKLAGSNGLVVFQYADSFVWPSEVFRLDLGTGKSEGAFRQKDRSVTDAALFPGGGGMLAAVEPVGNLRSAPIPGKVRMLASTDLKSWTEMNVDYRAVARSVVLAGPDAEHMWAATDTGMILKLTPAPTAP